MASSSTSTTCTGPPPTPTSLLELPKAWLRDFVACSSSQPWEEYKGLLFLFRTCTFFRDMVCQQRQASLSFHVPIPTKNFPGDVNRLCTLARRSSNIQLCFEGQPGRNDQGELHPVEEPHITHLLVCALAQLGEQQLTCIKGVALTHLEQTALVPAWVKVLCPNVTSLSSHGSTITSHLLQPPLVQPSPSSTSAPASPPSLICQHLRELLWCPSLLYSPPPAVTKQVQQQLAALPSLSSLGFQDTSVLSSHEHLISKSVTSLTVNEMSKAEIRLQVQFPNLRHFRFRDGEVGDAGLEALLSLPHLERVQVSSFYLHQSHAHRSCAWRELEVDELSVDSFARLPLEHIAACRVGPEIVPSTDVQAVQRVVAALQRWCAFDSMAYVTFDGQDKDLAALLTTLPLLAPVLPVKAITFDDLSVVESSAMQQLGQHLPACVTELRLHNCDLIPGAWPALLPSLPPSVKNVTFEHSSATKREVLAMCAAAVRPITVEVHALTSASKEHIRQQLAQQGTPQYVTLI